MTSRPRQSDLTEAALAERAVGLLARREHSRSELRRKLLRRRTSETASEGLGARADAVLDDLARRGLLSDVRFAESFIRRGIDRGHGPLKIRAGLRSRGVAEDIIDDALTFSDAFWLKHAEAAQRKRFGSASDEETSKRTSEQIPARTGRSEWAARARFLAARGFASDIIYRTLGPQTL